MKLLTLFVLIIFAILAFCVFCTNGFTENMTPNPYVISWQNPTYSGGDPACCEYEWQICSDEQCKNIVDSGKIAQGSPLTASTTKLDWQNTYYAWVRAKNSAGPGDWSKITIKTGDGLIDEVVIAEAINPDGTISMPLTNASTKISVWAKLSGAPLKQPNTYQGISSVSVNRNKAQVQKFSLPLTSGLLPATGPATSNIFYGTYPISGLQTNDTVDVDIYISQPGVPPEVTETISTFVVIVVAPGSVTSLKANYSSPTFFPPPWSFVTGQIKSQLPAGPSVSGVTRDQCQQLCTNNSNCAFFWYDDVLNKCDQQALDISESNPPGTAAILATNDAGNYKIIENATFGNITPDVALTANNAMECSGRAWAYGQRLAKSAVFGSNSSFPGDNCFLINSPNPSTTPNVKTYVKP